jgi:hypothetical protein
MFGVLLALFVVLAVVQAGWWRRARAERGIRPQRWSWGRQEALSSGVAILGVIVYVLLTRWSAGGEEGWNFTVWRGRLAGPALFAFGLGMVVLGVARLERRSFLGWGLAMTAFGLAMPWIPSRPAFWVVGGVAMTVGGLTSALLLWRQLR